MAAPAYVENKASIENQVDFLLDRIFGPGDGITTAILFGGGTSADPITTEVADKNFIEYRTETTATSGDSRLMYLRHKKSGAGGYADCLRTVLDVACTTGTSYATAIHSTLQFSTTATHVLSGSGAGGRFTLGAGAATRTLTGKLAALQVDSDVATGNTLPTVHGFIRMVDNNSVVLSNAFVFPTIGNGLVVAAHTTDGISHSVRCIDEAGTVFYLMATTTATHRS